MVVDGAADLIAEIRRLIVGGETKVQQEALGMGTFPVRHPDPGLQLQPPYLDDAFGSHDQRTNLMSRITFSPNCSRSLRMISGFQVLSSS